MKKLLTLLSITGMFLFITLSSCKKEDDELIHSDFTGYYSASETFTTNNCGSGNDTYNFTIVQGNSPTEVYLQNFGGGVDNVKATINGSTITLDVQFGLPVNQGGTIDINSGTGTLTNNQLQMTYTATLNTPTTVCSGINASFTATK